MRGAEGAPRGRGRAGGRGEVARRALAHPAALLAFFLALDAALFALHFYALGLDGYVGWKLRLTTDGGVAESVGYGKAVAALAVLGLLRPVWRGAAAWMPALAFVFADDAFGWHEAVGGLVAARWPGAHAQDVGELVFLVVVGSALLVAPAVAWVRGGALGRRLGGEVAAFLVALAFFAVGVDVVHAVVDGARAGVVLGVVEDGGELVVMSCLVTRLAVWLVRLRF